MKGQVKARKQAEGKWQAEFRRNRRSVVRQPCPAYYLTQHAFKQRFCCASKPEPFRKTQQPHLEGGEGKGGCLCCLRSCSSSRVMSVAVVAASVGSALNAFLGLSGNLALVAAACLLLRCGRRCKLSCLLTGSKIFKDPFRTAEPSRRCMAMQRPIAKCLTTTRSRAAPGKAAAPLGSVCDNEDSSPVEHTTSTLLLHFLP